MITSMKHTFIMSKVDWLNNGHTYWDQTLLADLLQDYSGDRQVFVVSGNNIDVDEVSMEMEFLDKVLVIITSDEEGKFPISDLYHPDMKVLVTYPNREKHWGVDGYLPIGYAPRTRELVIQAPRYLNYFFSGQDTHQSRHEMIKALENVPNGILNPTQGFSQGLEYSEYMDYMCRAKVVPCPAGYVSPDSFRLYEALEAGCIPIVENKAFWTMLFGEVPFPVIENWDDLPELINYLKDRPDIANKCSAWWQLTKRNLKWKISQY